VRGQKTHFILLAIVGLLLAGCKHPASVQEPFLNEIVVSAAPIDDAFWLKLNRKRVDLYRAQLKTVPPVLVVRESHYAFDPRNGMGMHYGWLDGKVANLHIGFSELVALAYEKDYAHTEFPKAYTNGQWTNNYDVICTVTNQPKEALQAAAKKFLRQHYGLIWHLASKDSDVLLIRAKDPALLQSKSTTDFPNSKAISELAGELENYFSLPVLDKTGAVGRFDKKMELVPARWVNGRTTDLEENNKFLATYGLELVPGRLAQEWLVLEQ
jgi:hypothetical protein